MSALPFIPEQAPALAADAAPARSPWRIAAFALLAIASLALPFALSDYRLFLVTMTLITAIGVLGLNMLVGYNGQLSLGHGALYALGAYVTAVLMEHGGFAWWATLPVSAAVCFGFGFLFGWPALRLRATTSRSRPSRSRWPRRSCSSTRRSSHGPVACRASC